MKWIIKITNRSNQRILINYLPLDNIIEFIGQHKNNNLSWDDLIIIEEKEFKPENFNFIIENIIEIMDRKLEHISNLNKFFENKTEIEYNEE